MAERMFAVVKGQVQGVNFRFYTQKSAEQLGLGGYVRNLPDGDVEVLAEGERPALESLVSFLHEGSPSSEVDSVEVKWSDGDGSLTEFVIRG